jgi:uncharacterized membrane protein YraQ (UPF0718 family)
MHSSLEHKCHSKKKIDYLLWGSLLIASILYAAHWQFNSAIQSYSWLNILSQSVFELMNTIWWGIVLGVIMVAVLSKIPKEFVMKILGEGGTFRGVIRATLGGVLLDLCSHGILMVASKLYERGASIGQVMAFLIASPWNSFSLTLILIALIGVKWTLAFIILSMLIAIISGVIFDLLVKRKVLPKNQNQIDLPKDFKFFKEAKTSMQNTKFDSVFFKDMFFSGIKESRMVIRWILFGVVLAGIVRASIDSNSFQAFFGPTIAGLGLTILVATILEVCSEGSTPIAADILTRANAPGNSFAFLMTGVSTDYTEIMVLKDVTRSWKIVLFLPIITVSQVIFIAWIMNQFTM